MAKAGKGIFAGVAAAAMVKQANATVRAKIDLSVFQIHRALTAGAHALGQPRQCHVVTELLAALYLGQGFLLLLFFQIAVERKNRITPQQHRYQHAHDVAHIAAIAGQIRHQLDKKGKQRKENKAPDKRPPGAFTLPGKQPARHHQQRQGQRQAIEKNAQLLGPHRVLPLRVGGIAQLAPLLLGIGDGL